MVLRENRISTRPLLLVVALLCALAIGLTGVYALRSQSAPPQTGVTKSFPFYQDRPGPDSPSRNRPDAWSHIGT